ncbi:PTS sugar transporter subunit IIA [Intestinimonas butyriciproducens]|uniref:PTS sugar transporter subunit IIA n=1 Tax=Intestinimonas butyriciproducens TaxID=1297617 RepID=UPI00195BAD36|nr:PTS glucose transporter subunit IIA [Intestinimonas butyriciproducens]MBM6974567.1 PTS glucose transporter subunit IIA [Intestinimonas butyriciproducens]
MGIFDKLFSKKPNEIQLGAPVAGEAVALTEVSDPTFGDEILGKGVAIRPTSNRVVAPCDATVDLMFDTGHAVSLKADCGAEVLIHVGLETVSLSGQHFTVHAKNGDHVTAGQLLIEFDREAIAAAGYDVITPMVICNTSDYSAVNAHLNVSVQEGDPILTLIKP